MNNKDDEILLAHLSDLAKTGERKGRPAFSDFLDPVRAEKFKNHFRHGVMAWGGHEQAERKMLGFFPFEGAEADAFPIEVLQISFNAKFNAPPSHRDYLGSVLGLGIEREKTGDIRLTQSGALVYVCADIAGYIVANLERVGNIPVKAAVLNAEEAAAQTDVAAGRETRITVASLRLDAVVAGAFRLSRGKAAALIESEKVLVNWTPAANGSKNIQSGDVVTVRGMGRIQLDDAAGRTRKDRVVLKCVIF